MLVYVFYASFTTIFPRSSSVTHRHTCHCIYLRSTYIDLYAVRLAISRGQYDTVRYCEFFLPVARVVRTGRFKRRSFGADEKTQTNRERETYSFRSGRVLSDDSNMCVIFSILYNYFKLHLRISRSCLANMFTFNNIPCIAHYLFFFKHDSDDVIRSLVSIVIRIFPPVSIAIFIDIFIISQIAPPATPLQDFTYHWKQLMNFYVNHLTDCKVPIQTTGIPRHLDRLLEILLEEEKKENEPGPCLEYLLQHKLLDLLATLASAETPPGMRTVCLSFLRKLLGRSKYPLLHHTSIYGPVQRLIALCNGNPPSPIEVEEVQFLLTLCFLVCKYPHVTNIINDAPNVQRQNTTTKKNIERIEVEKVTYIPARRRNNNFNPLFEPLDTQAVTLINPNLFNSENEKRRSIEFNRPHSKAGTARGSSSQSNGSISSRETEIVSQSSSPVIQKEICGENSGVAQSSESRDYDVSQKNEDVALINEIDTHLQNLQDLRLDGEYGNTYDDSHCLDGDQSLLRPKTPEKSKCLLLDALLSYINTAVSNKLF